MFYLLILILIIDNIRKWHSWIKNNDNSWLKTMLARRLFSNVSLTVLIIFHGYHIITTRLIPKSENTQTDCKFKRAVLIQRTKESFSVLLWVSFLLFRGVCFDPTVLELMSCSFEFKWRFRHTVYKNIIL